MNQPKHLSIVSPMLEEANDEITEILAGLRNLTLNILITEESDILDNITFEKAV